MEFLYTIFFFVVVVGSCTGNVWSSGRPIYVIERFSLPERNNLKFALENSRAGIVYNLNPETDKESNNPSTSALISNSNTPESQSVETKELPKLVKPIPTEHKFKINSLHPPCHNTGCSEGLQCVYDKVWMCPTYIPDIPCSCRPGCKVGNTFIPMGKSLTVDECGNTCDCLGKDGQAVCTSKTCAKTVDTKEDKMDSLLKYLKKLVNIKLEDQEKTTTTPLQTSASGNIQQRKTKDINVSTRNDFPTKTRFPYNPRRTRSFYVRA